MLNINYYDEILKLPGLEDIKEFSKKLKKVSNNMNSISNNMVVVLPDLLWDARSGAGKTHLLKLLSEYLYTLKIIDFSGDVKYFEFLIDYCEQGKNLSELSRLIREVNFAAGYRNEYAGLLAIDISSWNGHYRESHFNRIMEYLSSIDDKVCIIFMVENFTIKEVEEVDYILSSYFRIRKIKLDYPKSIELVNYIIQKLNKYDLKLDSEAVDMLRESVNELRNYKYFDGYKTINRLCQDILFEICSQDGINNNKITKDMLLKYAKDGTYVMRMKDRSRFKRKQPIEV